MDRIVCDGLLHASVIVDGKHVVEVVEEEHVSYQLVAKKAFDELDNQQSVQEEEYRMRQRGRMAEQICGKHGFASYSCISYADTKESGDKEQSLVDAVVSRISLFN